jgi:TonB family protein
MTNTRLRLLFLAGLGKSKVMRTFQTVGLLVVLLSLPIATRSQQQSVSAPTTATAGTYANTTEGLKQLLLDMRTAAKEGNDDRLAAFVKDMEIPNCDAWLHRMYDSDKADSWMGLCEAKSRDPRERDMGEFFGHIAKQDGKITTRKVNDNPQPGKGLEWGWLQAIKQPLDIYWASWLPISEPKESEADTIGYFMFIDGGFRWESGIQSFKASQTKRAKIVLPQLTQKVDPVYPAEAAANHVSGTVRVYFVIGTDGVVHSPHAIRVAGFSEDPNLVKAAEEAVRQWRYLPLTIDGKPTEMDSHADVVFALKN